MPITPRGRRPSCSATTPSSSAVSGSMRMAEVIAGCATSARRRRALGVVDVLLGDRLLGRRIRLRVGSGLVGGLHRSPETRVPGFGHLVTGRLLAGAQLRT